MLKLFFLKKSKLSLDPPNSNYSNFLNVQCTLIIIIQALGMEGGKGKGFAIGFAFIILFLGDGFGAGDTDGDGFGAGFGESELGYEQFSDDRYDGDGPSLMVTVWH